MFAVVSIAEETFVRVCPTFESAVEWACQYIRENFEETFADLEAQGREGEDLVDEFALTLAPLDYFFIQQCREDQPAEV